MTRTEKIRSALDTELSPLRLSISDDSAQHTGHAGAASGHGHFSIDIVSAAFSGVSLLARHRMVYAALGSLMETDIHALSIKAHAPQD